MFRMNGWRLAAAAAGILSVLLLTLAWIPFPASLIIAGIACACAYYLFKANQADQAAQEQTRIIRMINHQRHDWMNELQVLFGYTKLKKYEILPDYMDKIRTNALHDSYLCKLGNPALIVYLLEHRLTPGECSVELELEQEIDLRKLALDEYSLYRLVSGLIDRIIASAAPSQDERNVVSLGFDEDGSELMIDVVYQGEADWQQLQSTVAVFLHKQKPGITVREQLYGEGQAVIALSLPFRG